MHTVTRFPVEEEVYHPLTCKPQVITYKDWIIHVHVYRAPQKGFS